MQHVAVAASLALACAAAAGGCPVTQTDGGFIFDRDGALGIKFGWNRLVPGKLHVGGRRLDGDAPPARAYLTDYGDEGFQPTYLVFPTPGCWETGGVGEARLSFIVRVEKICAGPDWQFDGVQRGWRVTNSPEEAR